MEEKRMKKKMEEMEDRMESRAAVSSRHRREWRDFREKVLAEAQDVESAKYARALADILKVYQEGERKACGFGEGDGADQNLEIAWSE